MDFLHLNHVPILFLLNDPSLYLPDLRGHVPNATSQPHLPFLVIHFLRLGALVPSQPRGGIESLVPFSLQSFDCLT